MLTKNDLQKQLECFETYGKPVIVHTSLKAIGAIDGGGEVLLDALIEHFTKNRGLLCIPTHTWKTCIMDLNNPESCIGVIPTLAAARRDGVRSMHPTHSIAVFGKGAEEFVENEIYSDSPTNPRGCYGNILKQDGFVLLVGVGQEKNTLIHCVEEILQIPNRLKDTITAKIIDKDGNAQIRQLRWFDPVIPDVSVNFGKFEPAFRHFGCIKDGVLGNAKVQLCSASKMMSALETIYKNSDGKELLADNLPLAEALYKTEVK